MEKAAAVAEAIAAESAEVGMEAVWEWMAGTSGRMEAEAMAV